MQVLVRALNYAVTEPICNRFVKLQLVKTSHPKQFNPFRMARYS